MNNVIKFPKPANQYKAKKTLATNLFRFSFIMLAILFVYDALNSGPPLYREHGVKIFSKPLKVPGDYIVSDLTGKEHKLSEVMGNNMTILAFWATWCSFCAQEFPEMDAVIPSLANKGIKIVPIARGDDSSHKVDQFFKRVGVHNVKSLIATTRELHAFLGVNAYPTFVAVDSNGMAFAKLRPRWGSADINELFDMMGKNSQEK